AVALFEPLHATGGVNQLLLAGEERMAGGADLGVDLLAGRTGLECVTTQTFHGNIGINGVDAFFHLFLLHIWAKKIKQFFAGIFYVSDSIFFLQPFFCLTTFPETRIFLSWQGCRGTERRRSTLEGINSATPHDQFRRLTPPGRKKTVSYLLMESRKSWLVFASESLSSRNSM